MDNGVPSLGQESRLRLVDLNFICHEDLLTVEGRRGLGEGDETREQRCRGRGLL